MPPAEQGPAAGATGAEPANPRFTVFVRALDGKSVCIGGLCCMMLSD